MIFASYLTDFSYFPSKNVFRKLLDIRYSIIIDCIFEFSIKLKLVFERFTCVL